MINPQFVYLAIALSVFGAWGYIRDTLRGVTSPNRVTWGLWGIEGLLSAAVEIQQHVGLAALMTVVFGLVPIVVVSVSFRNSHAVWKIGPFDIVCGVISLLGIVLWALINQSTVALWTFVAADQIAGLPTMRKAWLAPESETATAFAMGTVNSVITLMTLREITTAGALFPGFIAITDSIITLIILGRLGPRMRSRSGAAV